MDIEWQVKDGQSPYKFLKRADWEGVSVHRADVVAGRLVPQTFEHHEININLHGTMKNERVGPAGNVVTQLETERSLCFSTAGQTASAYWDGPLDNLGIHIDPEFLARTASQNFGRFEFTKYYAESDELVLNIGLALLAEADNENGNGKLYADSLIHTLMHHVVRNYTSPGEIKTANGGLPGYKLRRVREYINDNIDQDLGLADLANVAGLSQFHFARSFRKSTGRTPQQFLTEHRIERAKDLLAKQDLPIVEVSLRTGFKSQSHFTQLFRKYTSLTPKNWRELKLA